MDAHDNPFDWANNAFVALSEFNPSLTSPADNDDFGFKPNLNCTLASYPSSAFSIPPSLLTQASVERHGQVTPPDDLSPAEPRRDSAFRDSSIPLDQLHNEALWPADRIHPLPDTDNQAQVEAQEQSSSRAPKRRRTSKEAPAQAPATQAQQNTDANANPQPPKRKRGRPKLNPQPQPVDSLSAESGGAPITSARQTHLEKNRVAAHKCRQRKKDYINTLEKRSREFSATNKALRDNVAMLRDEVLQLKNEVLRHAGCGYWAVDEYLARCAGDLVGKDGECVFSCKGNQLQSPVGSTIETQDGRELSADTTPSRGTDEMNDEFEGLELLKVFDEGSQDVQV